MTSISTHSTRRAVAALAALGALLWADPAAAAPPTPSADPPVELYFEMKLMLRGRHLWRRVELDQWAGARLLMRREQLDAGARLTLERPLEHPWTFRWYPTKDEAKLGAAVAFAEPEGDAYATLEALVLPLAREKHRAWWNSDRVDATAGTEPEWSERADAFWSEQHVREEAEKDPLHPDPVYPFYVLGDPAGRFTLFVCGSRAAVDADSIVDRMSEPWLARGWDDWREGRHRSGYGYWGSERPHWEPRTYQTLAAALRLLAWPLPEPSNGRPAEIIVDGLIDELAATVVSLVPRAAGRVDWSGSPRIRYAAPAAPTGVASLWIGDSGDQRVADRSGVGFRVWRATRLPGDGSTPPADEIQLWAAGDDERTLKVWIKVGYRPATD